MTGCICGVIGIGAQHSAACMRHNPFGPQPRTDAAVMRGVAAGEIMRLRSLLVEAAHVIRVLGAKDPDQWDDIDALLARLDAEVGHG